MPNQTNVANAQSSIAQINQQLAAAQKAFAQAAVGRDAAKNAVAQTQSQINALSDKVVATQGTPAYAAALAEYNAKAPVLSQTLSNLKATQATFQQQINAADSTIKNLNGQLTQAQSDLNSAQSATANTTGTTATSVDNGFIVELPGGAVKFESQAAYEAWQKDQSSVVSQNIGGVVTYSLANNGTTATGQSAPDPVEIPDYTNDTPAPPLTGLAAINAGVASGTLVAGTATTRVENGITITEQPFFATTSTPQTVDPQAEGTKPTDNPATLEDYAAEALRLNQAGEAERDARTQGILADLRKTQGSATEQDTKNSKAAKDWRVRISLAPKANYFYRAPNPGILAPLSATDGVIFPYTPSISVAYTATYDQQALTHSNYKTTYYQSSSVDNISITCDFTAQDTYEANYLLATIHFFRSLTKMFYGQDQDPARGTPPPLCYLHGYGDFQFNKHPMAITGFTYQLPQDVDFIRTDTTNMAAGQPLYMGGKNGLTSRGAPTEKVSDSGPSIKFGTSQVQPTYVPTKIQLAITAIPVVSRYDVSNKFSLADYASGALLRGTKDSGGFW